MSNEPKSALPRQRWETRQLATMALFIAIGVVLSFIEFPLIPAVPWLFYDASNVPAMLAGFAFGPAAGCLVGTLIALLHGLLKVDPVGAVMNIIGMVFYVLPAALLYKRFKGTGSIIVGLVLGSVVSAAVVILANFVFTPLYFGGTVEEVMMMLVPVLLPFNALKVLLNSVLAFVLYKSLYRLLNRSSA